MRKKEIYEREGERPDQTPLLGKKLSFTQDMCYKIICDSGINPISAVDVGRALLSNKNYVQLYISKIRQKLGSEEIIYKPKQGYISKRSLIDNMVARNREKAE